MRILFYAPFYLASGTRDTEIPLDASLSASELLEKLSGQWPALVPLFGEVDPQEGSRKVTLISGEKILKGSDRIGPGDTVKILGPLSGG